MSTHTVKMPDLGEGITEVEVVAWHVQAGDTVTEDQVLADVMTENLRFYADMVIRAGDDYPPAVLDQQLQVLGVELGALGLKPLAALADRYLAHVKAYQTDGRVQREAWLADWKSR